MGAVCLAFVSFLGTLSYDEEKFAGGAQRNDYVFMRSRRLEGKTELNDAGAYFLRSQCLAQVAARI